MPDTEGKAKGDGKQKTIKEVVEQKGKPGVSAPPSPLSLIHI